MEPLRGGKGMLYEGGIRVPLIVRWPGNIKPNTTCDIPMIGMDFYPTLLEIAGAQKPQSQTIDGLNLVSLFHGNVNELNRKALFWHFPAYLQGKAKGARDSYFRTRPAGAVRAGEWKLIEYFEDSDLELYNLKDDISESKNLKEEFPEKTKELHRMLQTWRQTINAPVPTERNPEYNPEK